MTEPVISFSPSTKDKQMRFSDVTEDGTYMLDASGDLHRMEYSSGYMVGVKPFAAAYASNVLPEIEIPKLTLFGRWTDDSDTQLGEVIYWDVVEVIDNLLDAGNIARQRGELAIWDNFNGKEIRV